MFVEINARSVRVGADCRKEGVDLEEAVAWHQL